MIGVNVGDDFNGMTYNFLNCSEGLILFKYLGLPVGAYPWKMSTWVLMLRGKLNSWGNKYVCLWGRIVHLNSVLNAISIFYLSFLKMPVRFGKEWLEFKDSSFGVVWMDAERSGLIGEWCVNLRLKVVWGLEMRGWWI